jgi:cyclophilin family peptidyl-prolyl cis-trans isomerase
LAAWLFLGVLIVASICPAMAEERSVWQKINPLRWVSGTSGSSPASASQTEPVNQPSIRLFKKQTVDKANPEETTVYTSGPPVRQAALIETERGNMGIELYPDQAPVTVKNFVSLVEKGFYNQPNMYFHRVVPGFVIQTGDPTGTGSGGSGKRIPLEAKNKLRHGSKGVVAMARGMDPDSATSQFYITVAPQPSLDGKYAIFGKVVSGLEVIDKIRKNDKLYGVKLIDARDLIPDPKAKGQGLFAPFRQLMKASH